MEKISTEQIKDASGTLVSVFSRIGYKTETPAGVLQTPSYTEAATLLGQEASSDIFTMSSAQLVNQRRMITRLAGLRVMVAVVDSSRRQLFLPGVIVADNAGARVGCLRAAPDVRSSDSTSVSEPLTDYQQLLLAKLFAQHQPGSGSHDRGPLVTEVNHASLIAASDSAIDIHHTVHELVDGGQFSAKLARGGATNIATSKGIRANDEIILGLDQIAGIAVNRGHQAPLPMSANGFDVSAGFTLAARRTVGKGSADALKANAEGMS